MASVVMEQQNSQKFTNYAQSTGSIHSQVVKFYRSIFFDSLESVAES